MRGLDDHLHPPEEPEFCEVCGSHYDDCICPICDVCGDSGNPGCYVPLDRPSHIIDPCPGHGLQRTQEQKNRLKQNEEFWRKQAESEEA